MPGTARLVVACVKWGTLYSAHDVNCLYYATARHLPLQEWSFVPDERGDATRNG